MKLTMHRVQPGGLMDCDCTSISVLIAHATNHDIPFHTGDLDKFWNEEEKNYQCSLEHGQRTFSPFLTVLHAYLIAPDVTMSDKQRVWKRTVDALEHYPWTEMYDSGPAYLWMRLVGVFAPHVTSFPEQPTRVHIRATQQLLRCQLPSGAFSPYPGYVEGSCNETAFALTALKTMRQHKLSWINEQANLESRIDAAIEAAEDWLLQEVPRIGSDDSIDHESDELERSAMEAELSVVPLNVWQSLAIASLGMK